MTGAGAGAPEVHVGEPAAVTEALADDLESVARESLAQQQRFTIAIPGGSVATICFPRLALLSLDWSAIDFFWTDERAVPPDHADSNYAAARSLWLEPARVPEERLHRMRGEEDLERAAREYADELESIAGRPPRLDYALLGVGVDGHVASLFPDRLTLDDPRPVQPVTDSPKPPRRRLTLSLGMLARARRVAIVAFGIEKATPIREALANAASMLPIARLVRAAPECVMFLGRDLAELL